jgi:hypothetical protein
MFLVAHSHTAGRRPTTHPLLPHQVRDSGEARATHTRSKGLLHTEFMSAKADRAVKDHLHQCLRWARDEVVPKLEALDEYDVRRPMTRTGLNLLGLVKHLAFYAASYFGLVFDRPYPEPLPRWTRTFATRI